MTNLDRVVVTCYRLNVQVHRVNRLTIVVRGVHLGLAIDVVVRRNRVVCTCCTENTVVEHEGLTLTDMFVQMLMERVCILDKPAGHTIALVSAVVVDHSAVGHVVPRRDSRNRIHIHTRFRDPGRVVRPEELNRITLTDAVGIFRYMRLVRTNDDVEGFGSVAVVHHGVIGHFDTDPFAFPFIYFLSVRVECRMYRVAYIERFLFDCFLTDEDRVSLVDVKVRNNRQVEVHDRVATASRLILEGGVPSVSVDRVFLYLTNHVRQFVFADCIVDGDIVGRIHFDLHRVQRIASQECVAEDGIAHISEAVPGDTFRLTATQNHQCIDRYLHRQIEGMVRDDEVLLITHSVGIETGRVQ